MLRASANVLARVSLAGYRATPACRAPGAFAGCVGMARPMPFVSSVSWTRCFAAAADKAEAVKIKVMFGSQTGTAQSFSKSLAKSAKKRHFVPSIVDLEDFDADQVVEMRDGHQPLLLVLATFGNGEPTDNAKDFYSWLASEERTAGGEVKGLKYAVFGLGNSTTYPDRYNIFAKRVDARLEELGAERFAPLGLGDDSKQIEEDFDQWKSALWPHLRAATGTAAGTVPDNKIREQDSAPNLLLEEHDENHLPQPMPYKPRGGVFTPVMCVDNHELHAPESTRSCRHVEFDISSTGLKYEAGDHLAVAPSNCPVLVNKIGDLLDVDLDRYVSFHVVDKDIALDAPFPSPCTIRHALQHFCDITGPPRISTLRGLQRYASAAGDKAKLAEFIAGGTTCATGGAEAAEARTYKDDVREQMKSIVDVLSDLPSVRPPISYLLEILPPLQLRFYSISSSPRMKPSSIELTVGLVRKPRPAGLPEFKGVASNYIRRMVPGDPFGGTPVFVRSAAFKLPPPEQDLPVVMLAAGTGLAPMRSFIQERTARIRDGYKYQQPFVLYFGCMHEHRDFIYHDEIKRAVADGVITELRTAFSHDTDRLVFVQHRLLEDRERVWAYLNGGAHVYVCGAADTMAQAVNRTFQQIIAENGGAGAEGASAYVADLMAQGRYQEDIY